MGWWYGLDLGLESRFANSNTVVWTEAKRIECVCEVE